MAENMENKLAVIQRENVAMLLICCELTSGQFAAKAGLSNSTYHSCFGKNPHTAPSKKSLEKVYQVFALEPDVLNKPGGITAKSKIERAVKPGIFDSAPGSDNTPVNIQIGSTTIHSEIPASRVKALLAYIILGEDLEEN